MMILVKFAIPLPTLSNTTTTQIFTTFSVATEPSTKWCWSMIWNNVSSSWADPVWLTEVKNQELTD